MKKIVFALFFTFFIAVNATEKVSDSDLTFLSAVYLITATENTKQLEQLPVPQNTIDLLTNMYSKHKDKIDIVHCCAVAFKEKINQKQYYLNSIDLARVFIKNKDLDILRFDMSPLDDGGWCNLRVNDKINIYDFYITFPTKNANTKNLPAPYPVTIIILKVPIN